MSLHDLTYLGTEWATNPVVRGDLPVSRLLQTSGADTYPERTAELLELMDANPSWHMNATSDGERRRVQIVMGLMKPFRVLLLDEVTVDLDVVVRQDLLGFLRRESEDRSATIVYATHIFDGLGNWPTHVAHMAGGRIRAVHRVEDIPELKQYAAESAVSGMSPLMRVVEGWLRRDLKERRKGGKVYDDGHAGEFAKKEVKGYGITLKSPQQLYDYSH
ncbi:hypothetical protein DFJ74DRAFT_687297 [Hyaloraphidium curvatum]|nr:hypothetical protein DFJ74DRAFT_687297 [Hyaloraphidium curvatum]